MVLPFFKGLLHFWFLLIPITALHSVWGLSVSYREVVWFIWGVTVCDSPTTSDTYSTVINASLKLYKGNPHIHSKNCRAIHCLVFLWDFLPGREHKGCHLGGMGSFWPVGTQAMINILISSVITCVKEKTLDGLSSRWVEFSLSSRPGFYYWEYCSRRG